MLILLLITSLYSCSKENEYIKTIENQSGYNWIQSKIIFVQTTDVEDMSFPGGLWVDKGEIIEVETDADYFYVNFLDEEYLKRKTRLIPFNKGKGVVRFEDVLEEAIPQSQNLNH